MKSVSRDRPIIMSAPMVRASLREIAAPGTGKSETRRLAEKWAEFDSAPTKKFLEHADFSRARKDGVGSDVQYLQVPCHIDDAGAYQWRGPCDECMRMGWVGTTHRLWPRVRVGDRLWVREAIRRNWSPNYRHDPASVWTYSADNTPIALAAGDPRIPTMVAWAHHQDRQHVTAIHLPRWASRLTLVVTSVAIERLQEITAGAAIAEGLDRSVVYPNRWLDYVKGAGAGGWSDPRKSYLTLWNKLHGRDAWDSNPFVVVIRFKPQLINIDAIPQPEAA